MSEQSTLVHRVAVAPIINAACQRLLDRSRPAEEARLRTELGAPQNALRKPTSVDMPAAIGKQEGAS